jgi:hypothetical protein
MEWINDGGEGQECLIDRPLSFADCQILAHGPLPPDRGVFVPLHCRPEPPPKTVPGPYPSTNQYFSSRTQNASVHPFGSSCFIL